MQFITIKESHYASDLLVLKSRLESEGIKCHLKDELTTQVLQHLPSLSVKLQVLRADLDKVQKIMKEMGE